MTSQKLVSNKILILKLILMRIILIHKHNELAIRRTNNRSRHVSVAILSSSPFYIVGGLEGNLFARRLTVDAAAKVHKSSNGYVLNALAGNGESEGANPKGTLDVEGLLSIRHSCNQ